MSLQKVYYGLILGIACLLYSCQDTKKENISIPTSSVDSVKVKKDTSVQEKNTPEIIDDSNTYNSPDWKALTTKSAPKFFKNYGKDNPETRVKLETNLGDIVIQLYEDTPLHRANFIFLVKEGYFDLSTFHRVAKDFIIQAGSNDSKEVGQTRNAIGRHYLLPAEINLSRTHRLGTVSGAKEYRDNPGHQTAPYEFFIFVGEPVSGRHLNDSYTIFGEVVEGLDIAKKISELETDGGEWPIQLIYIKASVLD